MKNHTISIRALLTAMAALLTLACGSALAAPMTPEMAAKAETTKKQQSQRITDQKRKAASEALKAERLKVYEAKKAAAAAPQNNPTTR